MIWTISNNNNNTCVTTNTTFGQKDKHFYGSFTVTFGCVLHQNTVSWNEKKNE